MGYTHYWTFKKDKTKTAKEVEELYQKAIKECQMIAVKYNEECEDSDARLSGYTAHSKVGSYGGLKINGKEENAHEDFCFREHFSENESFDFCKTARKPYDIVVTACLAVLKYRLGDSISVSSDGCVSDWNAGIELARRIIKRKIKNPIKGQDDENS